jgi:hypothetical protein
LLDVDLAGVCIKKAFHAVLGLQDRMHGAKPFWRVSA